MSNGEAAYNAWRDAMAKKPSHYPPWNMLENLYQQAWETAAQVAIRNETEMIFEATQHEGYDQQ